MKKNIIYLSLFILPSMAFAVTYTGKVDLENITVNDGDIFFSELQTSNNVLVGKEGNTKAINLNANSGITVKLDSKIGNTIPSAIFLKDGLEHNLGGKTKIYVDSHHWGYGIDIANSKINATNLSIIGNHIDNPTGGEWYYGAGAINAKGSEINLGDNSYLQGGEQKAIEHGLGVVILKDQSKLTANQLHIKGMGTQNGLSIDNSDADLGQGSTVEAGFTGVYLHGNANFKADNLSIVMSDVSRLDPIGKNDEGAGINVNHPGSSADLGNNSKIMTHGKNSHGAYLFDGKLTAKNLTINALGQESVGLKSLGGKAGLDGGVLHSEHSAAIQGENGSLGGGAPGTHLKLNDFQISANGNVAVYMAQKAKLDLKNSTITSGESTKFSVYGSTESILNLENTQIDSTLNNNAVSLLATSGSNINLSGNNDIRSNLFAMISDQNTTKINQEGKLNSKGNIQAQNGGSIQLNTSANSLITGQVISSPTSTINWQGAGTVWNVTDSSRLNDLALDKDSQINLAYSSNNNDIAIHNLSGEALWHFKINFDNNTSDTLHVTGTSKGNHKVALVNNGSMRTNGTEKKDIIFTADGVATFQVDKDYELGGYLYTVQRKGKDANSPIWEVASKGRETTPITKKTIGTVVSNYYLNLAEQEHLQRRMSTLRDNPEANGVWARTYHGKYTSFQDKHLDGFGMKYSGIQIGFDHVLQPRGNDIWMLGGSLNYTDSKQDYKNGDGKQKSYSLAAYATYFNADNWYIDLYGKISKYDNKLDMRDTVGMRVNGSGNGRALTASAEIGKRFYLTNDTDKQLYIEPNAQVVVSRLHSDSIRNSNGLIVDFDNQTSVISRLGAKFGYNLQNSSTPINFYGKLSALHEFNGKQKYYLNGSREELRLAGTWLEYGVGANVTLKKDHNVFFEVIGNKGKKFNRYDLNIGYRYVF